jgi:protein-S-isoprenylcysteine O-methyltransferase Ste14
VTRAWGRFVFKYRDYLAPAILLVAIVSTRPHPFLGSYRWDVLLDVAGVAVALSGQGLRVLVIGLAYIKRGGRNKQITANSLVCDGVFAHSRNPLYVGNFLMLTGLFLIWNSAWAYVLLLPAAAFSLFAMVVAEEAFLSERFGEEYAAYSARVNRFIPNFRGFRQTLSRFTFDWRQVIRKEFGTTFSWMTTALALMALERILWHGASAAKGALAGLGLVWLCLLGLWGLARWLKKSGRLNPV